MRLPILSAVLALSPAAAFADDCAPVLAAYGKLAEVPAYRQVVAMAGQPGMETIAVGDTLYVQTHGKWTKMPLPPGGRKQVMQQALGGTDGIKACAAAGADAIGGAAMTVHAYDPPAMGGFNTGRQKVWIGDADGLPHRMATEDGSTIVEIAYEGVVAPM